MSSLETTATGLLQLLEEQPGWGTLAPASIESIAATSDLLALPAALQRFYKAFNPCSLRLPWICEELCLYPVEALWDRQAGYRWDANNPRIALEDWNPRWLVIGDMSGDPIIVDAETVSAPVSFAIHGMGKWSPLQISPDITGFLELLVQWLRERKKDGGPIAGHEGEMSAGLVTRISAHLPAEDRQRLLAYMAV